MTVGLMLAVALPYAEIPRGNGIIPNVVSDWNVRQAAVWSLEKYGLPLQNVVLYYGNSQPMYYPAGPYLAVAASASMGGASVPQAWPFALLVAVVMGSLCLLIADTAARFFPGRRTAAWAVALVVCGGLDLLVLAGRRAAHLTVPMAYLDAWTGEGGTCITNLYLGTLWTAPHVVPVAGALLLLRWLPLSFRRSGTLISAALICAGMFYFSAYVAVGWSVVVAAAMLRQVLLGRWRRWLGHMAAGLSVAALGFLLSLLWLTDMRVAEKAHKASLVPGMIKASLHSVSLLVSGPLGKFGDLLVQMAVDLSPVVPLAVLAAFLLKPAHRYRFHSSVLYLALLLMPILICFISSTGLGNDWGMRNAYLLEACAAIPAAGLIVCWNRWRRAAKILVGVAMGLGLVATTWEIAAENGGRCFRDPIQDRDEIYQVGRFISGNTSADAIVMFDPRITNTSYALRWCDRRSILANEAHASMAYADPQILGLARQAGKDLVQNGLCRSEIDRLRGCGATVAVVPPSDLTDDFPPWRLMYQNSKFAVVDLRPSQ